MKSFSEKVFAVVSKIPKGETLTYKQVAEKAGRPKAYRAVGNILNTNYDPKIPCHRVVRSDGKTGGWNRGSEKKAQLLKTEQHKGKKSKVYSLMLVSSEWYYI